MKKVGKLYLPPQGLWQKISINVIRPLPRLNDKDVKVVIVDWFTKMIRLRATITVVSLEKIAKIYRDDI